MDRLGGGTNGADHVCLDYLVLLEDAHRLLSLPDCGRPHQELHLHPGRQALPRCASLPRIIHPLASALQSSLLGT